MFLLDLLLLLFIATLLLIVLIQLILPLIFNTPVFPFFRKKELFKEAKEADEKFKETVLRKEIRNTVEKTNELNNN